MTDSTHTADLLLPELEHELSLTRKMITHLPDFAPDFKPHEKSMTFTRLAGHTADLPAFITFILTQPDIEMTPGMHTPLVYESKQQLLAGFNELADKAVAALKQTSDETFRQYWTLKVGGGKTLFSGPRYSAYRTMGVNHMIHHRAQLGVYLRLNNLPVPATYGTSADEK